MGNRSSVAVAFHRPVPNQKFLPSFPCLALVDCWPRFSQWEEETVVLFPVIGSCAVTDAEMAGRWTSPTEVHLALFCTSHRFRFALPGVIVPETLNVGLQKAIDMFFEFSNDLSSKNRKSNRPPVRSYGILYPSSGCTKTSNSK